ncbi:MAG: TldD/PmbA family protein [Deltaproteobacteria bacterium]|nr:TldD/PmbA family protein [Deltaproteobacteria bacterium]
MSAESKDLLDQARQGMKIALARGAQGVRATVHRNSESSVERRNAHIERVRESTSLSLSLALYVDGRYSSNTTSDLRPQAIEQFIGESVAMTRALAPDPNRALADPDRYASRIATDLKLFDREVLNVSPDWRRQMASEVEAGARSLPEIHKQILSVQTSCSTSLSELAKVTSNGMEGIETNSNFSLSAQVTVRDANDRKPAAGWYATSISKSKLASPQEVGQRAARRAARRVGASPRATGEYPCVIENACANRLLDALWSALEGGAIQQKRSFLAGKIGQTVGSPLLHVIDDPHVIEGLGSTAFDYEGMATRPRPVFERGTLRSFYLDTYYARKLKTDATSGARGNLVWERGGVDLDGLLANMGTGILITNFIGGNSNSATGDFSFGVQGQWFDKGQRVGPIAEMNLSANHLTFWRKLVELGNDPYPYSSNRRPSLRFDAVQFSGK